MGKILNKELIARQDLENAKTLSSEEQVKLGIKYFRKSSAYKNDIVAFKIFQMAAENNNPQALVYLARMYHEGLAVESNIEKSIKCLKKSANLGSINAMCILGEIARNENNTSLSAEDCVRYYTKAADLGSLYAKFCLADIYKSGKPVKKDIEKAIRYYSVCITAQPISKNMGILAESYFGLVQCYLELHYTEEANTTRDANYYNTSKKNKEIAKQYLVEATKLKDLVSKHIKEKFENTLSVYSSILNENDVDLSKMPYEIFFMEYFNKHPRIFLLTKKSERLIYSDGIRSYFLKRDSESNELRYELKHKIKALNKRKNIFKKVVENLEISSPDDTVFTSYQEVMSSLDNELEKYKQEYLVDYSTCVTNIDKYLEEILHLIFVVEMHKYKKHNLNKKIEQQESLISKLINQLSLEKLKKYNNIANNINLNCPTEKIDQEKHITLLNSFIKKMIEQKTPRSTEQRLETLYEHQKTEIEEQEFEMIENIKNLQLTIDELHGLKINQSFQLGSLFDLTFVDRNIDESIKISTPHKLKDEILSFVESINPNKNKNEIYLKLHELILKIECFRVMIRNVASHKSILNQSAMEKGLNLCIVQQNSIFNLIDELFGNYLETQIYLKDVQNFSKKIKSNISNQSIDLLIKTAMEDNDKNFTVI